VIGGGLIGAEVALHLSNNGKIVTIIEMLGGIALDHEPLSHVGLNIKLGEGGVNILTGCKVTEILGDGVMYVDESGNRERVKCDSVVVSPALVAKREEAAKFAGAAPRVMEIGDCVQGRKIYDCFHEAWNAILSI